MKKRVNPDIRLAILGLKPEDLIGLSQKEQIKVLEMYHESAKRNYSDTKSKNKNYLKKIHQAYKDLEQLVNNGYFTEKKEEDIYDETFIQSLNQANQHKMLEARLDEYAAEKVEKRKRVSQMTDKFNNPSFSIKDAIQYCGGKIRNLIRKVSDFHKEDGEER